MEASEELDPLSRAQGGDVDAFGHFYDQHARDLLRWFQRRTAAADTAADLCAETFAQALGSLSGYDADRGEPAAWLFGIARNQLRHWHRRLEVDRRARQRLQIHVTSPAEDDLDLVDLRADLETRLGPLARSLERLSPGVREAVVARVVDGLSYAEVATLAGCSAGAARVRVSRGLASLLADLGDETAGAEQRSAPRRRSGERVAAGLRPGRTGG